MLRVRFPVVTQPKRMIDQTGGSVEERIAEERESSNAQIGTMLDEQRRTIIAEYGEKLLHHEFLAAQAEQNRRILQEELLRQQQDFREGHQQDLMKMKELQKFQNSTFDEFTKQKFIEDQKIIMELSGRLQEIQNEVNCMNDSKDFQDAESIRSGNSHVTSQPGLFPEHPPFEGWPGGWGPQGMSLTGGGGLARVPNLRVCYHLLEEGWHTQGEKDELTSCRGTV